MLQCVENRCVLNRRLHLCLPNVLMKQIVRKRVPNLYGPAIEKARRSNIVSRYTAIQREVIMPRVLRACVGVHTLRLDATVSRCSLRDMLHRLWSKASTTFTCRPITHVEQCTRSCICTRKRNGLLFFNVSESEATGGPTHRQWSSFLSSSAYTVMQTARALRGVPVYSPARPTQLGMLGWVDLGSSVCRPATDCLSKTIVAAVSYFYKHCPPSRQQVVTTREMYRLPCYKLPSSHCQARELQMPDMNFYRYLKSSPLIA